VIARAPGRVNLIGEHTDYNLGFVLPIALDLETRIRVGPSPDGHLQVHSANQAETRSWPMEEIASLHRQHHWSDYVIGVAQQLIARGFPLQPRTFEIESTVPEGAGLSSSAALEVASALAFLEGREMNRLEIARLCQLAESEFVGVPCGIMDQYVALFGREHSALKIDCRSLESEAVPLPENVAILAVNSMVKHSLGQSAYRTRVAECQEACRQAGVASLRDATLTQVQGNKRARHVVSENQRVLDFVEASQAGDLRRMGQLFFESHTSMRDDYEISCAEIDFLVDTAAKIPGCYGARMTGGGFGGCTVNLIAPETAETFKASILKAYPKAQIFRCVPSSGASVEPT
jgi:galactokinase